MYGVKYCEQDEAQYPIQDYTFLNVVPLFAPFININWFTTVTLKGHIPCKQKLN